MKHILKRQETCRKWLNLWLREAQSPKEKIVGARGSDNRRWGMRERTRGAEYNEIPTRKRVIEALVSGGISNNWSKTNIKLLIGGEYCFDWVKSWPEDLAETTCQALITIWTNSKIQILKLNFSYDSFVFHSRSLLVTVLQWPCL